MRPALAEALGTFLIVLVALRFGPGTGTGPLAAGAAVGIAHLAAALSFGHVSYGLFNPVLTIASRLAGRFGGSLTFTVLAQIVGATLAALAAPLLAPQAIPVPAPAAALTMAAVLILIGLVTLVSLAAAVLRGDLAPFATAAILAVAVALAPEGGLAALNPAQATALAATPGAPDLPLALWRLWLAGLVGGAVAVWLLRRVLPDRPRTDPP
jgi:glycerol uptake facilitator-like aquaporin